jgi:hypothetical protein
VISEVNKSLLVRESLLIQDNCWSDRKSPKREKVEQEEGDPMDASDKQKEPTPQKLLRDVLTLCADCDTCRTMMEGDCAFFIELYRLQDQEREEGVSISEAQLRYLAELCTFCGLCPCSRVPMDVMEAKSRYIEKEGMQMDQLLVTDRELGLQRSRLCCHCQANRFATFLYSSLDLSRID